MKHKRQKGVTDQEWSSDDCSIEWGDVGRFDFVEKSQVLS